MTRFKTLNSIRSFRQQLVIVLAGICVSGCLGIPDNATAVGDFELERYLGTWYEIARLDHRFERGLTHVTAQYSLRDDGGVRVVNTGYDERRNEWSTAEGKAYFIDSPSQGRLKVSFFGPFYGAYNVVELDSDYRYSMVVGPNTSYLWILARDPELDSATRQHLIERARQMGFDITALIFPAHGDTDTMPAPPNMTNEKAATDLELSLDAPMWRTVNDGVMGGVSSSRALGTDSGLRFLGSLSLENNGGFASIRRPLDSALTGVTHVELRARGDGRQYQLRLRETQGWDGVAWRHHFTAGDSWQTHQLALADFEPVYRGRVLGQRVPLQERQIQQIGLMLADGIPGDFKLELSDIRFQF